MNSLIKHFKHFRLIPSNIYYIGIVSLLINASTIIILSLSPLYLTKIAGLSVLSLGFFEGIVEFTSWVSRIFSGILCDYFRKRKLILLPAYIFIALGRPIWIFSKSIHFIFVSRILDRLGNGLGATSRDALVGDFSPEKFKGSSFGLRQSCGQVGSLAGAVFLFLYIGKDISDLQYKIIFSIASLLALLSLLFLLFFVKDKVNNNDQSDKNSDIQVDFKKKCKKSYKRFVEVLKNVEKLPPNYWKVIIVSTFFSLTIYNNAFKGIYAYSKLDFVGVLPLVQVFQNFGSMFSAYPAGVWSDKIGRPKLLGLGIIFSILANVLIVMSNGYFILLLSIFIWGLHSGITKSLWVAEITAQTDQSNRGIALGIYYVSTGVAILIANILMGAIYKNFSAEAAFLTCAFISFISLFLLPIISKIHVPPNI